MRRLYICLLSLILPFGAKAEIDTGKALQEWHRNAKSASLCESDEQVIATCKLKEKSASICFKESSTISYGHVKYRFGQKGKVEIEIPNKSGAQPGVVAYMLEMGASSSAGYYRFISGQYKYYVYSASSRGPNDPETGASTRLEPAGIIVMQGSKRIISRECSEAYFPGDEIKRYKEYVKELGPNDNEIFPTELIYQISL